MCARLCSGQDDNFSGGLIFSRGNVGGCLGGIVRSGCPIQDHTYLRVAVAIWAAVVNTQTHTQRERHMDGQTDSF